jgi:hypothetical protein
MSTKYLALHDLRLMGGVPNRPHLRILNLDKSTPVSRVLSAVISAAAHGKIDTIFVLCHGFAGTNEGGLACTDAGGGGLAFGRENVTHANVSRWTAIRNRVRNIVVYACAAADTEPENEGTDYDGKYLMGALSIHTNATVFAADRIQWYLPDPVRLLFGRWEGKLWEFRPDGSVNVPRSPPVSIDKVSA